MSGNSVYIHVPFCTRKCDYCHFFVLPHKEKFVRDYLTALELEIKLKPLPHPLTIYFGGGTPSLLGPQIIGEILSWIPHSPDIEITLEVNPEHVSEELMRAYAHIGINRVSLGLQSLDDGELITLTRHHTSMSGIGAIEKVYRSGIENISIDLMYDLPDQTLQSWRKTLAQVRTLPITHLSLYNLTIEPHTPFYKRKESLQKKIPTSETSLQMLQEAVLAFENVGLHRYEISAFAKKGFESKHNSGYWTGRPFIGYGPSAFSYMDGRRFRNVANLNKYVSALREGKNAVDFEEELSPSAKQRELFAIHLRLTEGAPKPEGVDIDHLIQDGFLEQAGSKIRLTEKGKLFYDHVAEEIIEI